MTKKELIKFLEPFTDDIKIFTWNQQSDELEHSRLSYRINKEDEIYKDILSNFEAYIIISS